MKMSPETRILPRVNPKIWYFFSGFGRFLNWTRYLCWRVSLVSLKVKKAFLAFFCRGYGVWFRLPLGTNGARPL